MNGYENLTDEQKQLCYEIIARLLGLRADVTMERITPAVAQKVQEFLDEVSQCSGRAKQIMDAYFSLFGKMSKIYDFFGNIADLIEKIYEAEEKSKRMSVFFAPCYFSAKNKYAQEIQYLFFMEGK